MLCYLICVDLCYKVSEFAFGCPIVCKIMVFVSLFLVCFIFFVLCVFYSESIVFLSLSESVEETRRAEDSKPTTGLLI
jgi:hypothetical protein